MTYECTTKCTEWSYGPPQTAVERSGIAEQTGSDRGAWKRKCGHEQGIAETLTGNAL